MVPPRWLVGCWAVSCAAVEVRVPPTGWVSMLESREKGRKVGLASTEVMALESVLNEFPAVWREPYVRVVAEGAKVKAPEGSLEARLAQLEAEGASAVFRVEELSEDEWMEATFGGGGASTHLYVSSPGAAALANHSDTTDVAIYQLAGTKRWFACAGDRVEDSRLARKLGRCETYDDEDMARVVAVAHAYDDCATFDLKPGEAVYLPRRTVHSARADETEFSVHVTVGLATAERRLQATVYEDGCDEAGLTTDCFCSPLLPNETARSDCDMEGGASGPRCPPGTFSPTGYYSAPSSTSCDDGCDASCDSGCDSGSSSCDSSCDDSCDASCFDCGGCEACPSGRFTPDHGSDFCALCADTLRSEACAADCETAPPSTAAPSLPPLDVDDPATTSPQPARAPTPRPTSASSKSSKKGGDNSSGAGLIVAVVVLAIVVLLLAAAFVYYLNRKKSHDSGYATAEAHDAYGVEIPAVVPVIGKKP